MWQEEWERFDAREQEGATAQCRRRANQPACDVNPHVESLVLLRVPSIVTRKVEYRHYHMYSNLADLDSNSRGISILILGC